MYFQGFTLKLRSILIFASFKSIGELTLVWLEKYKGTAYI
jgi:hypothetical protein